MNDLLSLMESRCSVRSFKDQKIEEVKVKKILEAAKASLTACNKQPQLIYVIESKEGLEKLSKCKHQKFNEQLAFLVCYDKDACWVRDYDGHISGEIDASIVATHMILEAESLGVNSTWIMHFDPQAVREEFELKNNIIPVCILAMGYKVDDYKPSNMHANRKDIEKFIVKC